MDKSKMPLDQNGYPIPVLTIKNSQVIDATSAASTDVFSTSFNIVVRVACVDDTWLKLGENPTAAESEGALFPGGSVEYIYVPAKNKIAIIGGVVSISETI